jgi:hypothetical protein
MLVEVRITLWPSDRKFRLPGNGTRSMIFRFDGEATEGLGGHAVSLDGLDFAPGSNHRSTIEFWADDYARGIVRDGGIFTVWYGSEIGQGRVTAVR